MNYALIEDAYVEDLDINFLLNYDNKDNKDDKDKNEENLIDANKLLTDYKKIKNILKSSRVLLFDLEKQKADILSYKSNIFVKHQEVMINLNKETSNIENQDYITTVNDTIINYIDYIKNFSDKWLNNYYLTTKKKLENDIDENEKKLISFNNLFIQTTNEIINVEKLNKKLCPICFENETDMCAIPCGHTCCNTCVLQSNNYNNYRKCLSCRNEIKQYIKIFFLI
jgi:hypothetical protein